MSWFGNAKRRISEFNKIAQIAEIARRYLALNTFDGILTIFGILIASFFAEIYTPRLIIIATLGAAIAIAISGFFGGYMAEYSERKGKIKKLEKQIGISLKKTDVTKAHKFAIIILAMIDGMSPFIAAILVILPFFFLADVRIAYYTAFAISAVLLFVVGAFLGKISKENIIKSGLKMVVVGAICFAVIYFVERLT